MAVQQVQIPAWSWRKLYAPPKVLRKRSHLVTINRVTLTDPEREGDVSRHRTHPLVLITGDGKNMPAEVKEFESWKVAHDLYCVNRSMLYFQRQIDHWAAIDIEESVWFAENVNPKIEDTKKIIRHTIGDQSIAYDVYWKMDIEETNTFQRRVLVGNTGFFAILTAIEMGYEKIVVAGMPLDMEPCWYEPDSDEGPNWMGWMYVQWMDFKTNVPAAQRVRSMSGYSEFILGKANKEWCNG
jgi:hypothetical protein